VREHHRVVSVSSSTVDQGPSVIAGLLHLTDVYVARMGPRAHRAALSSQRAARDAFLGPDGVPTPLGAAFVKTLGAHIPGSYVQLTSGEVAVVVRRGRRSNTPLVMALVGRQGMPLGEPALRDTSELVHAIRMGVSADEIKVRITPARLLARL